MLFVCIAIRTVFAASGAAGGVAVGGGDGVNVGVGGASGVDGEAVHADVAYVHSAVVVRLLIGRAKGSEASKNGVAGTTWKAFHCADRVGCG